MADQTADATMYSQDELEYQLQSVESKLEQPGLPYEDWSKLSNQRLKLKLQRSEVERNVQNAIGPELTPADVAQHLSTLRGKLVDFYNDQQRVREEAARLARDPSAKADTTPRVTRPDLTDGLDLKSPVQARALIHALGAISQDGSYGAEVQNFARQVLAGQHGDVHDELHRAGLDVDPVEWLHQLKHPRDKWPGDPDLGKHAERVLRGEAAEDSVPFLDLALERGELCLNDYMSWASEHEEVASKVRPKLAQLLAAAESRGLIRKHVHNGTKRRPESGYWLSKTGKPLHIPVELRPDYERAQQIGVV